MIMKEKIKKGPESPCARKIKCKYLVINGTRYRTLLNRKFENRKNWEAPDPTKILSYIPGTIKEVFVKEGQEIGEGEPLVTLEAMKMRNIITSHVNGQIIKVNVEKDQRIPKGHLLVQIK